MSRMEKSDSAIRAGKPANKGGRPTAERAEQRAGTEENPGGRNTCRTQCRESVDQATERIRQAVKRNPKERLTALLHHVSLDALRVAYLGLRGEAAAGVDGMTWTDYAEGLEERLLDLHRRVQAGAYRAPAVRRVYIPKPDGGTRPLGIAALEDKIVQKAVVDGILTPIYEAEFLGFSYGFRPGRGAHDALDALAYGIEKRKVNWIADADVRQFFDRIDRGWMLQFLEHKIGDKRLIRLIGRWLNAGVMDDGTWTDTVTGTPQGAIVSPVLANAFLHYVLDLWFQKQWRPKIPEGEALIVRYADDFVVGLQHKRDAEQFLRDLKERLGRFGLELHPEKTRLVEFGRFAAANRKARGQGKPETFDFLGFTHYCKVSSKGYFGLGRKPNRKRMTRTLARIKETLRRRWHRSIAENGEWLGRVLDGWLNYYAVPGSTRFLRCFAQRLKRLWLRALQRRSQKDKNTWENIGALVKRYWPKVRIRHPYPTRRFAVRHPR